MDLITPTKRPTLRALALPWRGASLGTLCAPLRHMRQTEPNIIVLAGLLLIWPTLVGCAPQTQYRRTALVAAPVSETLIRQPRGTVQVLGSVEGGVQDTDNFPEVGDPSVLRPTLWTSGELRIRVGDYVTLGMQATYASSRVSDGSAYGTPPLVKPRSYGGFGPNLAAIRWSRLRAFTDQTSARSRRRLICTRRWFRWTSTMSSLPSASAWSKVIGRISFV